MNNIVLCHLIHRYMNHSSDDQFWVFVSELADALTSSPYSKQAGQSSVLLLLFVLCSIIIMYSRNIVLR